MPSSFTWLDYSEHDRRRMLDVISRFHEKDTRDELGISTVRDAFADILFPGTSTIQTRARYLLFVPWIYMALEARRVPAAEIGAAARQAELALVGPLSRSADPSGTIGRVAGAGLQRLPSNIYWLGLERLGIRLVHGSQYQYHRGITAWYTAQRRSARRDDSGEDEALHPNWHPGLPPPPPDFPIQLSFALRPNEANYLRERILSHAPGTLLAYLVDQPAAPPPVDAPWQHPALTAFPDTIREQLRHARHFADVMHGAALLYNLMLAKQAERGDGQSEYEAGLRSWSKAIDTQRTELEAWDLRRFWTLATATPIPIAPAVRDFVETWIKLALSPTGAITVIHSEVARRLIQDRESALKGKKARLDNRPALELWTGASGTLPLRYRWYNARRIVTDIVQGLITENISA